MKWFFRAFAITCGVVLALVMVRVALFAGVFAWLWHAGYLRHH